MNEANLPNLIKDPEYAAQFEAKLTAQDTQAMAALIGLEGMAAEENAGQGSMEPAGAGQYSNQYGNTAHVETAHVIGTSAPRH
jgi:hypothetical protein